MMKIVPVINVSVEIKMNLKPAPGQRAGGRGLPLQPERDSDALNQAKDDRQIARVLCDLAAADLLLPELSSAPVDRGHQLQDDRGGDVGHDAEREDGDAPQSAAPENRSNTRTSHLTAPRAAPEPPVHARHRNVNSGRGYQNPEQNALAKVRTLNKLRTALRNDSNITDFLGIED